MNDHNLPKTFTQKVELILKKIPRGKVTSYGTIAALAGSPRAARQVVQIIHRTDNIPWHRVINSLGKIAIKDNDGFQEQKMLLSMEDVESDSNGKIELDKYQWKCYSIDELINLQE
jgi:methylated-DNA-protein-cysteine methyltransferase related protein